MAKNWAAVSQKRNEIMEAIPHSIRNKFFGKAGVYGIYIEGQLAYVGETINLLRRWVDHKFNTLYNFKQKEYQEEKYRVLREAYAAGLVITCDVLEFCEPNKKILRAREAAYIKKYNPILNIVNTGKHSDVYAKGHSFITKLLENSEKENKI
jgi:hypothetical protein